MIVKRRPFEEFERSFLHAATKVERSGKRDLFLCPVTAPCDGFRFIGRRKGEARRA